MEAQNPLSELADIHLPGGISWWPPAFGWWLVVVIILALFTWSLVQWLRQHKRKQALQAAISELDAVWRRYLSRTSVDSKQFSNRRGAEGVILLNGINAVLRRVALLKYPDVDLASLNGQAWLQFLDSCDGNSTHFTGKAGKVLGEALYRSSWDEDPSQVYKLAKAWIHRRYLLDSPLRKNSSAATRGMQEAGT